MAPPDPDETLSVVEALQALYVRLGLIAERIGPRHPSYFHLVKAGERLARAHMYARADRAARN